MRRSRPQVPRRLELKRERSSDAPGDAESYRGWFLRACVAVSKPLAHVCAPATGAHAQIVIHRAKVNGPPVRGICIVLILCAQKPISHARHSMVYASKTQLYTTIMYSFDCRHSDRQQPNRHESENRRRATSPYSVTSCVHLPPENRRAIVFSENGSMDVAEAPANPSSGSVCYV